MRVYELMSERRRSITAQIDALAAELKEIDLMLASTGRSSEQVPGGAADHVTVSRIANMRMPEQAIEAIKAGCTTPAKIVAFILKETGVAVTPASMRTCLTRLGKSGRIGHDAKGWCLPNPS